MSEFGPDEAALMRRAIDLSAQGVGRVQPNPLVGAVIVDRAGRVVGEGFHAEYGGPHAEVAAIEQAGSAARGGSMYVSLEPCAHRGKTPPCVQAIAAAGIRRIVYAVADPNPEAAGGADALRRLGVEVDRGLLADDAARADAAFHWWHATGTPFTALKLAVSLDGRIAERPGTGTRISGAEAWRATMRLRSAADAIVIGAGTARVDDPLLTVREVPPPRLLPLRVVIDGNARLSPESRLVATAGDVPLLLFVGRDADPERVRKLRGSGAEVEEVDTKPSGHLDLVSALRRLADRGCRSVLCEGGARLADSLLAEGLVQRLHWHVSPRVLGPDGVPALTASISGGWTTPRCRPAGADALIVWDHERLQAVLRGV